MLNSIQYLRGVAAMLVLDAHATHKIASLTGNHERLLTIGPSGVDLFFIISGFIMCYTTQGRKRSPIEFFAARCRRILPLYWTLTAVALCVFLINPAVVNSSGGTTTILHSFTLLPVGSKLLIQNGWTLSYELWFYLLFAAGLYFGKWKLSAVSLLLLGLVTLGAVNDIDSSVYEFLTSPLILEFQFGMVAFIYLRKFGHLKIVNGALLLCGVLLLASANSDVAPLHRTMSWGVPWALCFVGIVSFEDWFVRYKRSMIARALKLLGDSSYSLYLVHPFSVAACAIALRMSGLDNLPTLSYVCIIAISVITGYFSYRCVELRLAQAIIRRKEPRGIAALRTGH